MAGEHFVDLVAANAVSFDFTLVLGVEDAARFREAAEITEVPKVFWDTYERSEREHSVLARFANRQGREELTFEYRLVRYRSDPNRSTERVAAAVTSVLHSTEASCTADFEYPIDRWRPIIQLPVALEQSGANLPFDEIRGYRFAKRSDDQELLYSVVLDLIGERGHEMISIHVGYGHEGNLPIAGFATAAFLRGIQIAGQFALPMGGTTVER